MIEARSNEAGLEIPQTRQDLVPDLTSAPQRLQAKIKNRPPWKLYGRAEHLFLVIIPSMRNIAGPRLQ